MVSENCPNQCNPTTHLFLNRATRELVPCPICKTTLRDTLLTQDLSEELGIPDMKGYTGQLLLDKIIPAYEVSYLTPESYQGFCDYLQTLWGSLSQGILPSRSLALGLGMKGRVNQVAFPLLATSALAGLTVHPFISASEITALKLREDIEALEKLYSSQVLIVLLEEGASRAHLQVLKGVMQTRSIRSLPTIILTTWSVNSVATLIDSDPEVGYSLADPHFVQYLTSHTTADQPSKYSQVTMGILGLPNTIEG